MAILSSTGIAGFLSSAKATGKQILNKAGKFVPEFVEHFATGFTGHGWKIWERNGSGKYCLEIDDVVIRNTMVVFELLIHKIRAIIGAQAITQACGKIKTLELSADETEYLITIEDKDMSFVEHDFMRCQEFYGEQRMYHVEISAVVNGAIHVPVSEFSGSSLPLPGDDIVQFGNSSTDMKYAGRHSAIYMHADEGAQPAIDVLDGIYSKDWSNCLKVRLGGDLPGNEGTKGFYCVNGMIKGVTDKGHTTYCLYPDGTAELGDGAAIFRPDKSGHIAGGAIKWQWNEDKEKYVCTMQDVVLTWDNLSDDAKENLKGEPGNDGLDIVWKGDSGTSPVNPQKNWVYRNSNDGKVYIYNGSAWVVMVTDGNDGVDGARGSDGLSVFITYNDSFIEPSKPTGNGTTGGWHTNTSASVKWMSQKVAEAADSGEWGEPIKTKGEQGLQGEDATMYSIEFEQNGKLIQTIPALADGTPKITSEVTARLYKTVGNSKGLCSDYYLSLICTKSDGSRFATCSYDLASETLFAVFEGPVSYTISASPQLDAYPTDIVYSSTIHIVCDGKPGDPGSDAEVPGWVNDWTANATEVGNKYVVSPQMFSGIKNEDGTLTGIIQGKECITIDGEVRTGIFALVDGKTVFELDPVNKKYKFKGRVEADEGYIAGMDIVDKSLRGTQAIFGSYQIVVSTLRLDRNIVINNIDKQNSFIFELNDAIYEAIIALPSQSDLVEKGLDNYQFELTLGVAYNGINRKPLLINLEGNGVEIVHNYNIHKVSFAVAAGSVLKLLYLSGKYYLISTSDLDYTKVVLSKVPQ